MVSDKNPKSNQEWFRKLALTVRDIVGTHGGAIAMTREELRTAVIEEDASFKDCPEAVMNHSTLPLNRWARLSVSSYKGRRSDILLIHFSNMPVAVAKARCRSEGLSEAVNIALMERARA